MPISLPSSETKHDLNIRDDNDSCDNVITHNDTLDSITIRTDIAVLRSGIVATVELSTQKLSGNSKPCQPENPGMLKPVCFRVFRKAATLATIRMTGPQLRDTCAQASKRGWVSR